MRMRVLLTVLMVTVVTAMMRAQDFASRYMSENAGDTTLVCISVSPRMMEEILEKVKGQRIGDARSLLNSIEGVSDVQITTSFFWVSSIPSDANKVTINLINEEADQQTKEE